MLSPTRRLGRLVDYVFEPLSLPDRKVARDVILGIAASQTCVQSRWSAALGEENPDTTRRRLSRWMLKDIDVERCRDRLLMRNMRKLRARGGRGLVVPVDGVGVKHLHARLETGRGMDGVVRCWHGSTGETAPGHPHVLIQAVTPEGHQLPLDYMPWNRTAEVTTDGRRMPRWKNDIEPTFHAIDKIRWAVGEHAIFALDRGYHPRTFAAPLDKMKLHWIIRVSIKEKKRADRASIPPMHLAQLDGSVFPVSHLVPKAQFVAALMEQRCRDARKNIGPREVRLHRLPVRLTTGPKFDAVGPVRTLLVADDGRGDPLVTLADCELTSDEAVIRYHRAYLTRWSIETTIRQGKNRAGWGLQYEDTRSLKWEAIERMAFLVTIYQTFLSELAIAYEEAPSAAQSLLDLAWTPADEPVDLRYRIARGMSEHLKLRMHDERRRRLRGQLPH